MDSQSPASCPTIFLIAPLSGSNWKTGYVPGPSRSPAKTSDLPSGDHFVSLYPDRKSTRLNSSHRCISYAVFCLKKKKKVLSTAQYISRMQRTFYLPDFN